MSLVPTFLSNILPDDPVGEIKVDWFHSIGFTTLNSLYLVYRALFTFSLVDSTCVLFYLFGIAALFSNFQIVLGQKRGAIDNNYGRQ